MAAIFKSNMAAIEVSWKFGNSNFLVLYSI